MRNKPWVWLEVGDAGMSGTGAVPLRSAQMMGQLKKEKKKARKEKKRVTHSSTHSTTYRWVQADIMNKV